MNKKLYSTIDNKYCEFKTKKEILNYLEGDFKFKYTYGFEYRNPTTHKVDITKEEAINTIKEASFLDVTLLEDNIIHLNEFSLNDMY